MFFVQTAAQPLLMQIDRRQQSGLYFCVMLIVKLLHQSGNRIKPHFLSLVISLLAMMCLPRVYQLNNVLQALSMTHYKKFCSHSLSGFAYFVMSMLSICIMMKILHLIFQNLVLPKFRGLDDTEHWFLIIFITSKICCYGL